MTIVGFLGFFYFTDLESSSTFQNMFSPVMVGLFGMLLLIKFVLLLGPESGRGGRGDGGGYFGGGDGGGC